MRLTTITIFAVTGRLVSALVIAKPVPDGDAGGMAISLKRHSDFFLNSNKSIDLDAVSSHGISVREKILSGLDNYEVNTGTMHPFAVKRVGEFESGLYQRGASLPLKTYQNKIWMAEISIGTPPKTLTVQIDTGAADMWVLQAGCGVACGDRDLWNPDLSATAESQGQPFQIKYADGSIVKGDRYTDKVTIAGFTADPQTFGSATSFNSLLHDSDGLLGLAFPFISKFRSNTLLESLAQQRLIDPTFSLKLSSSGAEMYIGGVNSMLYNGGITFTPITKPGFWQVSMNAVQVNGHQILNNVPAIFDSGALYIYGDWKRVSEFYKSLGGTLLEYEGFGYYYLRCISMPTMTLSLTFGGRAFEISPEVFNIGPVEAGSPYCFGAIVAESYPIAFWTIGIAFLQGVYSVFDYTDLRVGFADLA